MISVLIGDRGEDKHIWRRRPFEGGVRDWRAKVTRNTDEPPEAERKTRTKLHPRAFVGSTALLTP